MKNKVFALAFSMLFFGSITATSYAQVLTSSSLITVVDGDGDGKDKKKTNKKKKSADSKSCKEKKSSCCDHKVVLKDDGCKDKDKKSDKDKK